jgi:undecaprenyl-diphosphatase
MDLIQAIILGIIQGLTEFLPISSSAHIRIAPALLGWEDPGAAFTANIQLGTLLAVLIYFWKDLKQFFGGWVASLSKPELRQTHEAKMGNAIAIGSIPIIVFGFIFKDNIETNLRSLEIVAGMLIFMAILLGIAEWRGSQNRNLESVTPKDGLMVGLWQAMALIPGCSRSGSTITGGMFLGLDRATAARFSFLLSVPSIFLAAVYTAYKSKDQLSEIIVPLIAANVASFVVGYACIAFLMKFLQTKSNLVFIVYRVVLGLAIFGLLGSGKIAKDQGMTPITAPPVESAP